MATKTFKSCTNSGKPLKFTPGNLCTYNGQKGRIWDKYTLQNNAWIYSGCLFSPLKTTRKEIVEGFNVD